MSPFLRIGHRGASAYEIENTLASFQRAIEIGANAIELDVRMAGDGNPVVIHDENLKRVFGRDLQVRKASVDELKERSGNAVPTLQEALYFIDRRVEKILVELKERGCEGKVLDIIAGEGMRDRVIIISFKEEFLAEVRSLDDEIETGLIYSRHRHPVAAARELGVQYLLPQYQAVQKADMEDAHRNGLRVIVWTINSRRLARLLEGSGVDGIASDRPDILS